MPLAEGSGPPRHEKLARRWERYARFVRRTKEAPTRFLLKKAALMLSRPAWSFSYRMNTTTIGRSALHDLTFHRERPTSPQEARKQDLNGPKRREDYDSLALFLRQVRPNHVEELGKRAQATLRHRVPCLGFGELDLGPSIDWHRDYVGGASWPNTSSLRLDFVRAGEHSDVKVPWEINRLQFLVWLGQAWRTRAQPEYIAKFIELLEDWWTYNPVGIGIAWSCPMEASVRGMNLATALALFWPRLDADTRERGRHLLHVHISYLRRHPELSDVNGNHYLADLVGLVYLGLATCTADRPPRWLQRTLRRLEEQVVEQFHMDGVHYEHSTGYHRLSTELILLTIVQLRRSGLSVPAEILERAERMVEFLAAVAGSNGHIPLIGDSDSGQVLVLGSSHPNDVRPLLCLGAILFDRPELKGDIAIIPAETLWQLGGEGLGAWDESVTDRSGMTARVFPDGGFVALTSGASKLVTRCGKPGLRGRGGHDHSDLTSFTAELLGVPIVVDTGSSSYTGFRQVRRHEISAAAHNMVLVDGQDPARIIPGSVMDVVGPHTEGRVLGVKSSPGRLSVHLTHNGFEGLDGVLGYRRLLHLSADGQTLDCEDHFAGTGFHHLVGYFYLAPAWRGSRQGADGYELVSDLGVRVCVSVDPSWQQVGLEGAEIAPLYGARVSTLRLRMEAWLPFPARLSTSLRILAEPTT